MLREGCIVNRRGFLAAILAAGCAPAIVRASSLMKVITQPSGVVTLDWEIVQGVIPENFIGEELASITRKAFMTTLITQLYDENPLLGIYDDHSLKFYDSAALCVASIKETDNTIPSLDGYAREWISRKSKLKLINGGRA